MLSVFDFGAKGDGVTNDGPALQRAIDACANKTLLWPHTQNGYRVAPQQDGIGLYIGSTIRLIGVGAGLIGSPKILFDNPNCDADCIVIEGLFPSTARGTEIENLRIDSLVYKENGGGHGRYGIVVHNGSVQLRNVSTAGFGNINSYFILQESGTAGLQLLGKTRVADGVYINSNFLQVHTPDIEFVGDLTTGTGGGLLAHGSDSKTVLYYPFFSHCGFSVTDNTLVGMAWHGGHSEANFAPLSSGSATRMFDVDAEDAAVHTPGGYTQYMTPQCFSIGEGSLKAPLFHYGDITQFINTYRETVYNGVTKKMGAFVNDPVQGAFMATAGDEVVGTGLHHFPDWLFPGGPLQNADNPLAEIWALGMTFSPGPSANPGPGYGMGITGPRHARGPMLPMIARPWMNSHRQWRYRQVNVVLQAGDNYVPLWQDWNHSFGIASCDPTVQNVDTTFDVTPALHYALPDPNSYLGQAAADAQMTQRMADLALTDITVKARVCLWQDSNGGNFGVHIVNGKGQPVTIDLFWTFTQFVISTAGGNSP